MAIPVGFLFTGIVVTMILVNFDSGATAAVLNDLSLGCKMKGNVLNPNYDPRFPCLSVVEQGMLGGLPFLGLCIGCPVVGRMLSAFSEKTVVLLGVLLDAFSTFIFAYVAEKHHMFMAKFLIGLSHSAICIYTPVWINHFGPPRSKTTWIGVVQGTGAIGTMVGYAATGYLTAGGMFYQNAFRIQAFGLLCCGFGLVLVPRSQVDSKYTAMQAPVDTESEIQHLRMDQSFHRMRTPSSEHFASFTGVVNNRTRALSELSCSSEGAARTMTDAHRLEPITEERAKETVNFDEPDMITAVSTLACNRMFRSLTAALCALFFVVTGIQYWMTKYLLVSFDRPRLEVHTVFLCVAGSAPILGIVFGGPMVDHLGGYDSPEGAKRTALLAGAWGAIASLAGIVAGSIAPGKEDWRMAIVICGTWVELLFGAAMLPPVTGLLLYSVEDNLKVSANALSMLCQNLFGYGIGAYLPGQVASLASDNEKTAMHYAMLLVFLTSLVGLLGMLDSYCAASAQAGEE